LVVLGNGGFLVVFLLKALSKNETFSRVKTQVLTILVRPDDGGVDALISGDVVLENRVERLGVITTGGAFTAVRL
jgi:hypothetical protein